MGVQTSPMARVYQHKLNAYEYCQQVNSVNSDFSKPFDKVNQTCALHLAKLKTN